MTTPLLVASATGLVPIFALPEVCLLPGDSMALRIFESRYRRMLADALEGERLIAIARLMPGFEAEYHGNPAVHPCMGVGEIVTHRGMPDGTSEIVLRGIARARLAEVVKNMPYRLGRLVDLEETNSNAERHAELLTTIRDRLEPFRRALYRLGCEVDELIAARDLPWRLAVVLDPDVDVRQRLIEADDIVERLGVLVRELEEDRNRDHMSRRLWEIHRRRRRDSGGMDCGS